MTERAAQHKTHALDRIEAIVVPLCEQHGVSLVELSWVTERAGLTLRVTIERTGEVFVPSQDGEEPVGGVTLADCANLSRDLSAALDTTEVVEHAYLLEVSSPGVERPLRNAADYARFAGKLVKLKLKKPAPDGQRVLRGTLMGVRGADGAEVTVKVDGRDISVPIIDVVDGHLVYELPKREKKSKIPSGNSALSVKKGLTASKDQGAAQAASTGRVGQSGRGKKR